jgi:hypothetical protein
MLMSRATVSKRWRRWLAEGAEGLGTALSLDPPIGFGEWGVERRDR